MAVQAWKSLLSSAEGVGPAKASWTTGVTCLPAQAKHTIAPDDWWPGKKLLVVADMNVGNVVTAQPTFTFDLKFGATSVWTSGAILTSTTVHAALPCHLEIELTCQLTGTSAQLMGQGWILGRPFLLTGAGAIGDLTTSGVPVIPLPQTTAALGTAFDSNASQQVDLFAACSASSASNTLQVTQYALYSNQVP
jgi:hypothetical protein